LELITFVEEKFGIAIGDSELIPENFDTQRKMSAFVERSSVRAGRPAESYRDAVPSSFSL
jgi:hypothetical protein